MKRVTKNFYNQLTPFTTTDTSSSFQLKQLNGFSIQLVYEGVGLVVVENPLFSVVFTLQASNDKDVERTQETWTTVSTQTVSQSSGSLLFNVTDAKSPYYRITTTVTIGQIDSLQMYLHAKEI